MQKLSLSVVALKQLKTTGVWSSVASLFTKSDLTDVATNAFSSADRYSTDAKLET